VISHMGSRRAWRRTTLRDIYFCYIAATFLSAWSLLACLSGLPLHFYLAAASIVVAATRFLDSITLDNNSVIIQSFSFLRGLSKRKIGRDEISHFDVLPNKYPNSRLSIYVVLKSGEEIRTPIRISMNQYTHIPPPESTQRIPAIKKLNDALGLVRP